MKIKVCGMREPANISAISQLSPSFMGFIFYSSSPRNVSTSLKAEEVLNLDKSIIPVAVFVNENLQKVIEIMEKFGFRHVQLHGNESIQYCKELKSKGVTILKVFSIEQTSDFDQINTYSQVCDYFLFDTKSPKHGGTGIKFDWNLLKEYKGDKPVFLSGGIGPEDAELVKKVIRNYPFVSGIDINSKFEISPGLKDPEKLKAFFQQLN